MLSYSMHLNEDEKAVLEGKRGETLQKALESVVRYGDIFEAKDLVPIDHAVHLVTSFGIPLLHPVFDMMEELIQSGLKTDQPFTVDPRPLDYENVPAGLLEKIVFSKIMYAKQDDYEAQLKKVGLKDSNAFTCACYFDEVGNTPKKGDVLAWAESSAVVYANSVLGARTNRNSGVLELLCGITGKAPRFGFLTDEGRQASWEVLIETDEPPEAQVLGSAIGMKVVEEVPYIRGLAKFFPNGLDEEARDYLKDMGAAAASNGSVGLYHVEGLTPEAVEKGDKLLKADKKEYRIDKAELQRVRDEYPVMWKKPDAKPKLCFIGCPHLSKHQIYRWLDRLEEAVKKTGTSRLKVPTVLTTAPDVEELIRKDGQAMARLERLGARLSSICPLMYMNNPLCAKKAVITCSNKLRTYTTARYFTEAQTADIAASGRIS